MLEREFHKRKEFVGVSAWATRRVSNDICVHVSVYVLVKSGPWLLTVPIERYRYRRSAAGALSTPPLGRLCIDTTARESNAILERRRLMPVQYSGLECRGHGIGCIHADISGKVRFGGS